MGIFASCSSSTGTLGRPELWGRKCWHALTLLWPPPPPPRGLRWSILLLPNPGPLTFLLEQGLAPAMFLTALPIPLDRTVPAGDVQPRASLATGSLGGGSRPFVLNPPAMAREGQPCPRGKPAAPVLSVNSVGPLSVLFAMPGNPRDDEQASMYCARSALRTA